MNAIDRRYEHCPKCGAQWIDHQAAVNLDSYYRPKCDGTPVTVKLAENGADEGEGD